MIEMLNKQVGDKDAEVASLKQELENLHIDVAGLNQKIETITKESEQTIKEKNEVIDTKTTELNTAFYAFGMKKELEAKNKGELLKLLKDIVPPNVSFVFIRQAEALGLGHAVYCARPVIGDEPFAVILADDMVEDGARGCMAQMVELYKHKKTSILGVERINPSDTASYGIVKIPATTDKYSPIELIVEKPKPEVAPSNLAVVGRYILTPAIFEKLKNTGRGAGGEIQLTDAIADLLDDEIVLAYEFEGTRYDCGSKLGFLIANVEMALLHNELKDNFSSYLRNLIKSDKL